ncbi:MAG: type 1 glutamine amidotransferase domain-containing protein [Chthoniobacterales bacterium]
MKLLNKHVAILAADGFEQSELQGPKEALELAGATVSIVSPAGRTIQAMKHADKGDVFDVDLPLDHAKPEDFDALMLPGGLMNPDTLRTNEDALQFVRHFAEAGKPIGAICHAPWILINAGLVAGRRLTSWEAISRDVENAGGLWENSEVVCDNGLVTSRKPADIPAFSDKLIEEIAEGRHSGMAAAATVTADYDKNSA